MLPSHHSKLAAKLSRVLGRLTLQLAFCLFVCLFFTMGVGHATNGSCYLPTILKLVQSHMGNTHLGSCL